MRETAAEQGVVFEPDRPDNIHRLNMGVFPEGVAIIPNPYNKIPGYGHLRPAAHAERALFVQGGMEATLTPLMESIEAEHPGVRVFSLPSVDHPTRGRHIELGVKGEPGAVDRAFAALRSGLTAFSGLQVSTE